MNKRGQASFEYLTITGFMLLVVGILVGFSLFFYNENSKAAQAQEAVNRIAGNTNLVASLGDGSRVYFEIDVPDGVQSFAIRNKSILMSVSSAGGVSDVQTYAKPNLTPVTLQTTKGRYSLSAYFTDGNVVIS